MSLLEPETTRTINTRKLLLYIAFAFGISWLFILLMKVLSIEYGSPASLAIIALLVMPGPAFATFIIQKFIYKEDFKRYGWKVDFKNYKWFLFTFLLSAGLVLLTFGVVGLLGNTNLVSAFGSVDFSQENFLTQLQEVAGDRISIEDIAPESLPQPVRTFFLAFLGAIFASITVNLPVMFGEEFGWRGLMLYETQAMGFLKSNLFIGLVWGLWHAPIILQGHNYPSNPVAGVFMMCLMTMALSPLFAYIRLKTKSILGPSILHGYINAMGALFFLFINDYNDFYSSIAGWAGIIACTLITLAIYVFDRAFVTNYVNLDRAE